MLIKESQKLYYNYGKAKKRAAPNFKNIATLRPDLSRKVSGSFSEQVIFGLKSEK